MDNSNFSSGQNRRVSFGSQWWFPVLVLTVSLASTYLLWRIVDRGILDRAEDLFRSRTEEISTRIVKRLTDHEQVLLGANALFHVMGDEVTRIAWRHYVSALNIDENHPGILGVGYAVWLPASEIEEHTRKIRGEGFPEYVIRPSVKRENYTSIIWLEPFHWRNQRAFGYDMYSEPVRRKAMARARDTGKTSVAAKVILVQETKEDQQRGMLMYVPSYRQGLPVDTVEERRRALRGFVYSPIRMNDFVLSTLGVLPSDLDFQIHAGEPSSDDSLLFSSALVTKRLLPEGYRAAFSSEKSIEAYGIRWHFTFSTLPEFDQQMNLGRSFTTLFAGILASVLLGTIAFLQARSRAQALGIAEERVRAATHIRETLERLKLATEVAGIGIWSWDLRENRIELDDTLGAWYELPDPVRLSGLAWDFWRSRIHPDDLERVETTLAEARHHGAPWEGEFRIVLPGERVRYIRAASVIERDSAGRALRMTGINYDITRQRELEENLRLAKDVAEEASRAKSEFLANMSHEIRTPMTVFLGALEHLRELDADPQRRHLLQMAEQSAYRLRGLIEDILDFSKIEARRVELHEEPVSVRQCVEEAATLLSLAAREKGLTLETLVSPDVPRVLLVDPDRLSQVLINLIGNAVKFTERGKVTVSVRADGAELLFSVTDTGPGIPLEKQGLLFRSFSQVDSSLTRRHGGTGLGLAISKGLVELMGGTIRVESRPGQGSTFAFTLPLRAGETTSQPSAEEPAWSLLQPETGGRILLAEDDPAVRQMVRMMIERFGHRVEEVENGREAVERWSEGRFDLILMDVQMPEVDGVMATRTIRRLEKERGTREIPIIALTAHARPEIEKECLDAGMSVFLTKPVGSQSLQAAIEEGLRKES